MNFLEYRGKQMLAAAGIPIPTGIHCLTAEDAAQAAAELGPCAIKAQVPAGKRGKAGGVKLVATADEARVAAESILKLKIGGYRVESLLVERKVSVKREFYAAVMNDLTARCPLLLFSLSGGMDIEELAANSPEAIVHIPVDIEQPLTSKDVLESLKELAVEPPLRHAIADFLTKLYAVFMEKDAELLEINPLGLLEDGSLLAMDCKLTLDGSSAYRQQDMAAQHAPEPRTELELAGEQIGLKYIELPGEVGVLANGAGLTMTTMDVISHFGGQPSNFLEIGGDAYTKAEPALNLVLSNPKVKSLVINFCGAFARTDVMTEGILRAWETLKPKIPVFFSVHGTGEDEAVALLRARLGITPYNHMEDAVSAAVEASK
ncbi:MAG TPA: ATP-grasp domain-containing protein [Castellaniella sp.]|uniref:succinate--CoA ligase subunit beta n=1 Tax=Castellaniella sp. TaxID=1955812 RepID=UPI002F16CF63